VTRLKIANEGAIRENIKMFIEALSKQENDEIQSRTSSIEDDFQLGS
jgi:hypothetical protein